MLPRQTDETPEMTANVIYRAEFSPSPHPQGCFVMRDAERTDAPMRSRARVDTRRREISEPARHWAEPDYRCSTTWVTIAIALVWRAATGRRQIDWERRVRALLPRITWLAHSYAMIIRFGTAGSSGDLSEQLSATGHQREKTL